MKTLTREEAQSRIEGVLRAAGIKVVIDGCGCCGSPWMEAEFPDGAVANVDGICIECDGISHQRS